MFYAAAREMVPYIIARSPNGMQRLTSIAFYEAAPLKNAAKKALKSKLSNHTYYICMLTCPLSAAANHCDYKQNDMTLFSLFTATDTLDPVVGPLVERVLRWPSFSFAEPRLS
jgi:hypothetical protein